MAHVQEGRAEVSVTRVQPCTLAVTWGASLLAELQAYHVGHSCEQKPGEGLLRRLLTCFGRACWAMLQAIRSSRAAQARLRQVGEAEVRTIRLYQSGDAPRATYYR